MSRSASAEPKMRAPARRTLLAALLLGALAACGRKGALELPPEPDEEAE